MKNGILSSVMPVVHPGGFRRDVHTLHETQRCYAQGIFPQEGHPHEMGDRGGYLQGYCEIEKII